MFFSSLSILPIRNQLRVDTFGCLIFLILFALPTNAQDDGESQECFQEDTQCVEEGQWNFAVSFGLGLRTNPLSKSSNIPLLILPEISYYQGNFFIENLDFGYRLMDTNDASVTLIATPSYDSVFFNRWDPGNLLVNLSSFGGVSSPTFDGTEQDITTQINSDELNNRKFSYLGGFEYNMKFDDNLLQLTALTDLTNTHSGKEIRFAWAHSFNSIVSSTLGLTWKDKKLSNYYYGVEPDEIIDDRGAYDAGASVSPFVRITLNNPTSDNNSWRLSLEYQKLGKQIARSPILEDDYVVTFYVGKRFGF